MLGRASADHWANAANQRDSGPRGHQVRTPASVGEVATVEVEAFARLDMRT
ncbi:hypothetical protein [Streptomyces sp. NPDC060205]|uniref:hypothetical protein n=1 Tax=Streptomyces sp. NPDC060205 TaxID=3347072 RepID=UPI003646A792